MVADEGADRWQVSQSLVIEAGGWATFGSTDGGVRTGVAVDMRYPWASLALSNAGDQLLLLADGVTVDAVRYDAAWPILAGQALQLDLDALDADANDLAANWCPAWPDAPGAETARGTPGEPNRSCADQPPAEGEGEGEGPAEGEGEGGVVCPDPDDPRVQHYDSDVVMCGAFFEGCNPGWELYYSVECGCGCVMAEPAEGEGEGPAEGEGEGGNGCATHCDCDQSWSCSGGSCVFDPNNIVFCCDRADCPPDRHCDHADGTPGQCPPGDPVEGEGEGGAICDRDCGCPQGQACVERVCTVVDPPRLCCAGRPCPAGAACVTPIGAMAQCGEGEEGEGEGAMEGEGEGPPGEGEGEPGNECQVACDCPDGQICSGGWCMMSYPEVWCCEGGVCPQGLGCRHAGDDLPGVCQ